MSDPLGWIDTRESAAPPALRASMARVIEESGVADGAVWDLLADAALHGLVRILSEPSERANAPRLLAVDALLTYACEAAAESGPDPLAALLERLDWHRFERLLEEVGG